MEKTLDFKERAPESDKRGTPENDFKRRASENIFMIRGIGIFLVVIGHVIGDRDTGIRQLYPEDLPGLVHLYDFIYTFHMPLFFLASGFSFTVFSQSNPKLPDFVKSRAKRLLIPLLCWAPIYYLLRSVTGKVDFQFIGMIEAIINPDFIFWFFPAIFFASILGSLFLRTMQSWLFHAVASLSLLVLSFHFTGEIFVWFYFNSFYFLGCVFGSYSLDSCEDKALPKWKIIWATSIMVCMMLFVYVLLNSENLPHLMAKFINGLLGFSSLYILLDSRSQFPLPNFLHSIADVSKTIFTYLGKVSMGIYLLHVICGATVRTILEKFGILEPSLQFALGLLVSVIGPVLLLRLFRENRLFLCSIGEAK